MGVLKGRWVRMQLQVENGPTPGATVVDQPAASHGTDPPHEGAHQPNASGPATEDARAGPAPDDARGKQDEHAFFSIDNARLVLSASGNADEQRKLRDEFYIIPRCMIHKFQKAKQLDRMRGCVALLFKSMVTFNKKPRALMKMCFWVTQEEWQDIASLKNLVDGIQAETGLHLTGLVDYADSEYRSNSRETEHLQGLVKEEFLLLEVQETGLKPELFVLRQERDASIFSVVPSYVAATGKFDRAQLGHSSQLKDRDASMLAAQTVQPSKLFCEEDLADNGLESIVDTIWTAVCRSGKVVRCPELFQASAPSKAVTGLLRKHGYHTQQTCPAGFDHEPLKEDLCLLSPRRSGQLRQIVSTLMAKEADFPRASEEACRLQGLPDLLAMAARRGHISKTPLDLAIAYGAMVQHAQQFEKDITAMPSTKRGRPFDSSKEKRRKKVMNFLKQQGSYMSDEIVSQATKMVSRPANTANTDQALVWEATPDAATEGPIVKQDPNTKMRKRTQKPKKQYRRRPGDELSLLEKRRIASRLKLGTVALSSPACG